MVVVVVHFVAEFCLNKLTLWILSRLLLQGLIGWWMVRSGLGDEVKGSKKEIRVSPIRLATHLGMAFTTFSCLMWTGESLGACR